MPDIPPLTPQAALETAVRDAIRAQLGYTEAQCERMFDERPPPRCGECFVSVWSPCDRVSQSRTSLDEVYNVAVTITLRLSRYPQDRRVGARDILTAMMDDIRALIHLDSWNHAIKNAANALAIRGQETNRRVGFCEALAFERLERWRVVGTDWFASDKPGEAGVVQTAYFGRARLLQAIVTAR